jgi:hypothetical protein
MFLVPPKTFWEGMGLCEEGRTYWPKGRGRETRYDDSWGYGAGSPAAGLSTPEVWSPDVPIVRP